MMFRSIPTRPKSSATVVVVLAVPSGPMSIPSDSLVIAASVVSGSISDRVPIAVVLPTPNPPATTILTGIGGAAVGGADRSTTSERSNTGDQPLDEGHVSGESGHVEAGCGIV